MSLYIFGVISSDDERRHTRDVAREYMIVPCRGSFLSFAAQILSDTKKTRKSTINGFKYRVTTVRAVMVEVMVTEVVREEVVRAEVVRVEVVRVELASPGQGSRS